MNTVALPPMTYVALQLMVNPPKMSTKCPVFASMVEAPQPCMVEALTSANAQLTKG
jgi:hypothetical protein